MTYTAARTAFHSVVLANLSGEARVATLLYEFALRQSTKGPDGYVFEMPLSRADAAVYLGLNPDTVSRIMAALKAEEVVLYLGRCRYRCSDIKRLAERSPVAGLLEEVIARKPHIMRSSLDCRRTILIDAFPRAEKPPIVTGNRRCAQARAMSDDTPLYYRLDRNDRIVEVGGTWDHFAQENGGEDVVSDRILGTQLFKHVSGKTSRDFIWTAVDSVRKLAAPRRFAYRCDSPEFKRFMEMLITPDAAGGLLVEHTTLRVEARSGQYVSSPVKEDEGSSSSAAACAIASASRGAGWSPKPRFRQISSIRT